jgi:hypothetical protein
MKNQECADVKLDFGNRLLTVLPALFRVFHA